MRDRREEEAGGGAQVVHRLSRGQGQRPVRGGEQVAARGRDVHDPGGQPIAVARFPDLKPRVTAQKLNQQARVISVEVLDNQDGGGKLCGQHGKQTIERAEPAGGGGRGHDQ